MTKAYEKVFGAAVEANQSYGQRIKHPVNGQLVHERQIRFGKTKKDKRNQ